MRGLCALVLVCIFLSQSSAEAFFFKKKDYRQIILNNAYNSEKRKDFKSAFHSFEKAMYYYPKDKNVIESYAEFCERKNYLDKAQELYLKLYVLTKDPKYLTKANICAIKNGKLADKEIQKAINSKNMTPTQKKELSQALIFHYKYKKDWKKVKKTCDSLPIKDIGIDIVQTCIVACENTSNTKNLLKYVIRNSELSPNDSSIINKVIDMAERSKDYKTEEIFVKKLYVLNPKDIGIRYKLAGVYEKQKEWLKASKVYESLMASGDKSEHVKNSYAYVLSQLHPKPQPIEQQHNRIYLPKPLSGFKLAEKNFYNAWREKDYESAQKYLSEMLKEQPNNKKLLQHRVDIDVSQNNYEDAIVNFEKIKTSSIKDTKFLAFLYSKTDNYPKALEIIETSLAESPENQDLLNLALEYSMALKDWDKAILYTEVLLSFEPKSEKLLKSAGDLYSIKKDFPNTIKYYEKLVEYYPKTDYQLGLANFYMANHEFVKAENILTLLYNNNPDNIEITKAYLNSLTAQQKIIQAYCVVKERHLENTLEGYTILGDLDMQYKHYGSAKNNYYQALRLDPCNLELQNKLADAYRMSDCICTAQKMYCRILSADPENVGARMGLGSVEIEKKNYKKARQIFCGILNEKPDYKPAKVGIAYSYIANDENFHALDTLNTIAPDQETRLLKSQIYYNLNMHTDAKENLAYTKGRDSEALKYKIRRDDAITLTPTYSFLKQQLAQEFRLNYQMGGIRLSKNIDRNTNVFMNYNVFVYSAEDALGLTNVTHELRGGAQGRPTEKWEYRADLGVKIFEFDNGAMVVTDDWVKYHFNDKFNLKLGFSRDNLIQTYTSAVGQYIDGQFTGRVADTRTYLEFLWKLPHDCYSFGRGAYGVMYAQNLPTNQYLEGMLGVGKLLYNNPKNPVIQKVNFDLVSFNWAFQYDLLNLYNSAGVLFGGYFSPSFFTADTANLRIEGEIKKLKLKYGCSGFAGVQVSRTPDFTTFTWGIGPYLSYRVNDHIDINASYQFYNYAFMQRHLFMVSAVIRGFGKNAKS